MIRRPGLIVASALIALLVSLSLTADFISSNPPDALNLGRFFAPPTRIHFFDERAVFHWRPHVCKYDLADPLEVRYEERPETKYPLELFCRGYGYRFLGVIPTNRHLIGTSAGQGFYPLGTDELGRDVLARVLAGARTSLAVVMAGICVYSLLGLAIGLLAGFAGGWVDAALMRTSEFVMALPALYLVLALRALVPVKISFGQTVLLIAGTIAAVTWPPMARGIRGLVLQLRSSGYVEASRSLGSSTWRIIRLHMLPAVLPFSLTQAVIAAPMFLLGEAVLSFLDVGFRDVGESWGSMLRNLKDPRILSGFWWNLAPLALIFVTLLCLTVISNSLSSSDAGKKALTT